MTMEDDRQRRDEIVRGERARALLAEPLIAEAFDALERQFTAAWRNSPPQDAEFRERIYHHLQALAEVRGYLEGTVLTGEMARQQLQPNQQTP